MEATFAYGLPAVFQFLGTDAIAIRKEVTHKIGQFRGRFLSSFFYGIGFIGELISGTAHGPCEESKQLQLVPSERW